MSSEALRLVTDRVCDFLVQMDLDPDRAGDGVFAFRHGSTVLMVSIFEAQGRCWLRLVSTVLVDVTPSVDLLAKLLRLNTEVIAGAFLLFDDSTLGFGHTLSADKLDFEEFQWAMGYVAAVGDDYDEELQGIAGGMRAEDLLG